jgi:hypothetical protein
VVLISARALSSNTSVAALVRFCLMPSQDRHAIQFFLFFCGACTQTKKQIAGQTEYLIAGQIKTRIAGHDN